MSLDDLVNTDLEARPQVRSEDVGAGEADRLAQLEAQVRANHERLMAGPDAEVYKKRLEQMERQLIRMYPDVARDMGLID